MNRIEDKSIDLTFNRTIQELKWHLDNPYTPTFDSFNRTIQELKYLCEYKRGKQ